MSVLLLYIIGARHRTSAPWNEHKTIVLTFYVASTKALWTMNRQKRKRVGGIGFVGKGSNLGCRRNWRPSRSTGGECSPVRQKFLEELYCRSQKFSRSMQVGAGDADFCWSIHSPQTGFNR
jgi:hypothetical protein